ncbi:MAG: 2-isopropylmalate synthase [Peptococcaceae bacterium]|nr:2-isopropylmalate synthase [Peptococcaceae bacterium]
MRKLFYLDTTLRDGEQSLGFTLNSQQKLLIAEQLVKLGVDIIEAGFPASSPGDFSSVREISNKVKGAAICGMARCVEKDIDLCVEALKKAESPMINLGLAVSPIHMEKKLKLNPAQVVERAVNAVHYAKKRLPEVQFYAEDALRSDPCFLREVFENVIEAGAAVVTVSDTVGCATPWKYGGLITYLKANVKNIDHVRLSTHCHNDLGMATANSLAGILAGADQTEGTINGIGERAGNASLEEMIMSILYLTEFENIQSGIIIKEIFKTSKMVSEITEMPIAKNKPIVGSNVYTHFSGIHQDGVIKEKSTYEIIDPEIIGAQKGKISLSARSGKAALKYKLDELGFAYHKSDLEFIFNRFKRTADNKTRVSEEDLSLLLE